MTHFSRATLPLNALRAFEAVARCESFRQGAAELRTAQSAVSRHVVSLERLLGARLFERRATGVRLTEAGRSLLKVVEPAFASIERSLNQLGEAPRLRLHVPPAFLQILAMPFIHEFQAANPGVVVEVASTYGTGVKMDGLDLAIVFDRARKTSFVRDLLWPIRVTPVCAPALAPQIRSAGIAALLESDRLLHVRVADEPANILWRKYATQANHHLAHERGVVFDTMPLSIEYALSGTGVALADVIMYADDLRAGKLAMPFDEVAELDYGYYLQTHPEAMETAYVRRFRAMLIARFARPFEQA